jgi:hypothetical protein
MVTLATLNERYQRINPSQKGNYVTQAGCAVGTMGRFWARSHSGKKVHFLHVNTIVGYVGDFQPKRHEPKIGDTFSAYATCNSNGQTGTPFGELDLDAITCKACLRHIEGIN